HEHVVLGFADNAALVEQLQPIGNRELVETGDAGMTHGVRGKMIGLLARHRPMAPNMITRLWRCWQGRLCSRLSPGHCTCAMQGSTGPLTSARHAIVSPCSGMRLS